MGGLLNFIRESNRIEGIVREPTKAEINVHEWFLDLEKPKTRDVVRFVETVSGAGLRNREGMNVRVGSHYPPPGNREMGFWLDDLLEAMFVGAEGSKTPWQVHARYEQLHPFMDGNGRSGRVLWAWVRLRENRDPFALGFLHAAYYEALDSAVSV